MIFKSFLYVPALLGQSGGLESLPPALFKWEKSHYYTANRFSRVYIGLVRRSSSRKYP